MSDILNDFKKWLHYHLSFKSRDQITQLITSLEKEVNSDVCTILKQNDTGGQIRYTIESSLSYVKLIIEGEDKKRDFLNYLKEQFNTSSNPTKKEIINEVKTDNSFLINHNKKFDDPEDFEIKPHKKESRYYNIKLLFSLLFYLAVIVGLVYTFFDNRGGFYFYLLFLVSIAVFFFLVSRFAKGILIGLIKGNAIKINEEQYPEIYEIVRHQVKQLKLPETPEVFIAYGYFNAFVTKLARKHYLLIFSEVLETYTKGDDKVLKFVIGHELGHIKRKHLTKNKFLFPSSFIPFLDSAYSRGCEYTCDRTGYSFSPEGAVDGIMILAAGKEIYAKFDPSRFLNTLEEDPSFWRWLSEKFLSHPHIVNRLKEIKYYNKFR